MNVKPRKVMESVQGYVPGKPVEAVMREYGITDVIKLASNENAFGSSPKAKQAVKNMMDEIQIYPDPGITALREKLASVYDMNAANIMVASGLSEILLLLPTAFVDYGEEVILADTTFTPYAARTKIIGGKPVFVPMKNWVHDLDAMADAINEKTKIVWICNPNNPTGTHLKEKELLEFFDKVPDNVIIAYDEAYTEYVTSDDHLRDSHKLIEKYENLVVMRTFSKIYGLCSLRVGYIFAHEKIIKELSKVRNPFSVSRQAQAAALAALDDTDFLDMCYNENRKGKKMLCDAFDEMGFYYPESESNFIFVDVKRDPQKVFTDLQKLGVIIRPQKETFLRVTIGTEEENRRLINALKTVCSR